MIFYLTRSLTGVVHKKNDPSKDRYFFLIVYQLATPYHYSSVNLSAYWQKMIRFRLFPFRSPLLRESFLLSFTRGTKMFQFPHLPSTTLSMSKKRQGSYRDDRVLPLTGFPIRKSSGYNVCSTTPRGLSQSTTSFFGVLCQGIHHAPLCNFLCI